MTVGGKPGRLPKPTKRQSGSAHSGYWQTYLDASSAVSQRERFGELTMTTNSDLLRRITARPDVFGGKPIIRDMRISVELILSLLAQGVSPKEILDDYPGLEVEDIRACAAYARAVIARDTLATVSVAEA